MGDVETVDHHYVPAFLLERFVCAPDEMLQAYSWNSHKNQLWRAPKAPRAVCYRPYLYTTKTHPHRPDELEKGLFGEVDGKASSAIRNLVERRHIRPQERDDLLTFLFSLDARRPAVVDAARLHGPARFAEKLDNDPELLAATNALGISTKPSDLAFANNAMAPADRLAFNLTEALVRRPKFAGHLRSASWAVRHIKPSVHVSPFALSDRPLIRVRGVHQNFIWALPLAPDCTLLIAALREDMETLRRTSDKQLANALNSDAVMQCDKYVFWSGTGPTGWLERRLKARSQEARQSAEDVAAKAFTLPAAETH